MEVIEKNEATLFETFYLERGCEHPQTTWISQGEIAIPGAHEIDFTFRKVHLILHTEETVRVFNERAICDLTDWKIDEAREITGRACKVFENGSPLIVPAAGKKVYGIYTIDSDRLFFGRLTPERDGSTAGKRPEDWDPIFYSRLLPAKSEL